MSVCDGCDRKPDRAGGWVLVSEDDYLPQGLRPEVLRRVTAGGGEAVALYHDIGKLNHEFGYAADGDVIAAPVTCVPLACCSSARDPAAVPPARELRLLGGRQAPVR